MVHAPVRRALSSRPASVGEARRVVRRTLDGVDRPELIETAELLVSEIVTNALVHAEPPLAMAVHVEDEGLRVEVSDGSPNPPSRRNYSPTAGTGRGLLLLEELVDEWGVSQHARGKTVWFRLGAAGAPQDPGGRPAASPDNVDVVLLQVPLLLFAAWHQHAETLLREHLLATIDAESPDEALQVHSSSSDAITLLTKHIPSFDVGEDPAQLLSVVTEPYITADRVEMHLPAGSVAHFETLRATLDSALALADAGLLLTPATQPELRNLRGWLCAQVSGQSAGAPAVPWSAEAGTAPTSAQPFVWEDTVTGSTESLVAADDTDGIVAVSDRAVRLLGYAARGELVGRRIVELIPERFRQAHLAGFTLHLLTGHGPLLGNPVVVPALRSDGSEIPVSLTITAHQLPYGRAVFVAQLLPGE